jgi:hypothetical protein
MKAPQILLVAAWLLTVCGAMADGQPAAGPGPVGAVGITAVSSRVSKDYVRTRLPDGSFQAEEYAFGDGGLVSGALRDPSIDKLKFLDIARVVARALSAQNYRPTRDLNTEKLLIVLYWGTTIVPSTFSGSVAAQNYQDAMRTVIESHLNVQKAYMLEAAAEIPLNMESAQRNQIDIRNSLLLGYDSDAVTGASYGANAGQIGVVGAHNDELLAELEDARFFVVLLAYDFQVFRKEGKHKLLWETRFSIDELKNDFDKALPTMVQYASIYFGQDSHGLLRRQIPDGQVRLGETKSLGEVEVPAK